MPGDWIRFLSNEELRGRTKLRSSFPAAVGVRSRSVPQSALNAVGRAELARADRAARGHVGSTWAGLTEAWRPVHDSGQAWRATTVVRYSESVNGAK